jgi:peptidoglycan/LPS O-acetylase OafA/YrhL
VFACGILTYYIYKALPDTFHTRRNAYILLAAGLMALYNAVDIGSHRILPEHVVFALGFLLFLLAQSIYPFPFMVNPVTCFLGRISFSFYIVHFAIMDAEIRLLHAHFDGMFSRPALAYLVLMMVTLALTIPVSWLTYTFIEQPFIRLGSKIVRRLNALYAAPKVAPVLAPSDS